MVTIFLSLSNFLFLIANNELLSLNLTICIYPNLDRPSVSLLQSRSSTTLFVKFKLSP